MYPQARKEGEGRGACLSPLASRLSLSLRRLLNLKLSPRPPLTTYSVDESFAQVGRALRHLWVRAFIGLIQSLTLAGGPGPPLRFLRVRLPRLC